MGPKGTKLRTRASMAALESQEVADSKIQRCLGKDLDAFQVLCNNIYIYIFFM